MCRVGFQLADDPSHLEEDPRCLVVASPAVPVGVREIGEGVVDADTDHPVTGEVLEQVRVVGPVETASVVEDEQRSRRVQPCRHVDPHRLALEVLGVGRLLCGTNVERVGRRPGQLVGEVEAGVEGGDGVRTRARQVLTGDPLRFVFAQPGNGAVNQAHFLSPGASPDLEMMDPRRQGGPGHGSCHRIEGEIPGKGGIEEQAVLVEADLLADDPLLGPDAPCHTLLAARATGG